MHQVGSLVGDAARVAPPMSFWDEYEDHEDAVAAPPTEGRTPFSLLDPEWFEVLGFDVAGAACLDTLARCMPSGWSVGEGVGRLLDVQGRARTELLRLSVDAHVVTMMPRYTVGVVDAAALPAFGQAPGVARIAVFDAGRPVRLSPEFDAGDASRRTQELVWMSTWLDSEVPGHEDPTRFWNSAPAIAA